MQTIKQIEQNNNRLADELLACFKTINENLVTHLRQIDSYIEHAKAGYPGNQRTLS